MKDSSLTKCVNESSTASLCYNNTIYIDHEKNPDGTYTTFVTVPKEQIDEWSPVYVTVHLKGTSTDPKCYHNGSASGMLLNLRYRWMIRCRIILMTYTTNNGVEVGTFYNELFGEAPPKKEYLFQASGI